MKNIPHEKTLDSSLALLSDGYPFIQKRSKRFHSNIFQTRLLGEKAICLHGEEAASIFYDNDKFRRSDAIPKRIQTTLMGEGGVQTLDNEAHRHRKAMFMSLMTPESIEQLMNIMAKDWRAYIRKWEKMNYITLFDDVQEIICLSACAWAGVPLKPTEVRERARDFGDMVDAFGGVGPRHWKGKWARRKTESWIRGIIRQIRAGKLQVEEGSAAQVIALHRDLEGKLLDRQIAAVELINIIRPIVAISFYVTFAALALHEHPAYRAKLQKGDDNLVEMFVQEVRRYYPFTPFLGARVRDKFRWQGHKFKEGTLVLLDVYGLLHDDKVWERANEFWPERFLHWEGSPFDFIPQGGGDYFTGHRCAGEWITIEALKVAVRVLTSCMTYQVPDQDLSFSLSRMPSLPKSGFKISCVKEIRTAPSSTSRPSRCPFHHM